jgi:hypothetical protein
VVVATGPGPLATADDGTYVYGRFRGRMSQHGVGNRTLANHPLARRLESKQTGTASRESEAQSAAVQSPGSTVRRAPTNGPRLATITDPSVDQPVSETRQDSSEESKQGGMCSWCYGWLCCKPAGSVDEETFVP